MADPLSAAASIAGLITLADLVANRVFHYVKTARATTAADDLVACQKLLTEIGSRLDRSQRPSSLDASSKFVAVRDKIACLKSQSGWPFTKSEIEESLREVAKYRATFSLAISIDSIATSLLIVDQTKSLNRRFNDLESTLRLLQLKEYERRLDKKDREILGILAPVNPLLKHDKVLKLQHEGTCAWLPDDPAFQHFLEHDHTHLWAHGIPGAGKTVLTSFAVDRLIKKLDRNQDGWAVFYCEHDKPLTQKVEVILGSLCKQLYVQAYQAQDILRTWAEDHASMVESHSPDSEALLEFLTELSQLFRTVYIVVDGLDECFAPRDHMLATMCSLDDIPNIKMMYTSRREADIMEHLSAFLQISVAATEADVRLYVASEIQSRSRLRRVELDLKSLILDRLVDGADGMFQWVKCQLDHITELPTPHARRKALDTLPHGLHDTYQRILHRINCTASTNKLLVQRVLKWIAFAREPLSSSALALAVSIEVGSTVLNHAAVPDIDEIRRLCGSLVRDDHSESLRLSHSSVGEFLRQIDPTSSPELASYQLDGSSSNVYICTTLLSYLLLHEFDRPLPSTALEYRRWCENHPLLPYAASSWQAHLWHSDHPIVQDLLGKLLALEKNQHFLHWHFHVQAEKQKRLMPDTFYTAYNDFIGNLYDTSPLHYACEFAIASIIERSVTIGADLNSPSTTMGKPLTCAITGRRGKHSGRQKSPRTTRDAELSNIGDEDQQRSLTIRLLLDAGVPQRIEEQPRHDPVFLAFDAQYEEAAKMLLDAGWKISSAALSLLSARYRQFPTAYPMHDRMRILRHVRLENLMSDAQARFRQLIAPLGSDPCFEWCQLPSDSSALVLRNSQESDMTMLLQAAGYGQISIVHRILKSMQSNVGLLKEWIPRSLLVSAQYGHTEVVRILLGTGDPKDAVCVSDRGDSALHLALQHHRPTVAKLLLDHYMDNSICLPVSGARRLTIVQRAIQARLEEFLIYFETTYSTLFAQELLVRTAGDQTCAHIAALGAQAGMVQYLHQRQMALNEEDHKGLTPVLAALSSDEEERIPSVLRAFFLNCGVTLHVLVDNGRSVLQGIAKLESRVASECLCVLREQDGGPEFLSQHVNLATGPRKRAAIHEALETYWQRQQFKEDDGAQFICDLITLVDIDLHAQDREGSVKSENGNFERNLLQLFGMLIDHDAHSELPEKSGRCWYHLSVQLPSSSLTGLPRLAVSFRERCLEQGITTFSARTGDELGWTVAHLCWIATTKKSDIQEMEIWSWLVHRLDIDILGALATKWPETAMHIMLRKLKPGTDPVQKYDTLELVRHMIKRGVALDDVDYERNTLLHAAAKNVFDVDTCSNLVQGSKVYTQVDMEGWTPMGIACRANNTAMIDALLDNGHDVNTRVPSPAHAELGDSTPPLAIATLFKSVAAMKALLKRGADTDFSQLPEVAPFVQSLCSQSFDGARTELFKLLPQPVDYNTRYTITCKCDHAFRLTDATLLHYAVAIENLAAVRFVCKRSKASIIDAEAAHKHTPLTLAIEVKNLKIATCLVKRGAAISRKGSRGWQPLHYAAAASEIKIIKMLLKHGANPRCSSGQHDENPAQTLLAIVRKKNPEAAKLLRAAAATHPRCDADGEKPWPIMLMSRRGKLAETSMDRIDGLGSFDEPFKRLGMGGYLATVAKHLTRLRQLSESTVAPEGMVPASKSNESCAAGSGGRPESGSKLAQEVEYTIFARKLISAEPAPTYSYAHNRRPPTYGTTEHTWKGYFSDSKRCASCHAPQPPEYHVRSYDYTYEAPRARRPSSTVRPRPPTTYYYPDEYGPRKDRVSARPKSPGYVYADQYATISKYPRKPPSKEYFPKVTSEKRDLQDRLDGL